MILPYNVDVPMRRYPIANIALIGVTSILSGLLLADSVRMEDLTWQVLFRDDEWFRVSQLVGSVFSHADPLHLIGNMLFLFCFGNAVNAKLGQFLFLLVYLLCGVGSNLAWLVLGDGEASLGASGAIMGVVGAFLVLFPRNDVNIFYWFGIWGAGTFSLSAYWVIGAYVGLDLVGVLRGSDSAVNYIAHVAGAVTGFAVVSGLVLSGLIKPRDEQTLYDAIRAGRRSGKSERGYALRSLDKAGTGRPTPRR